MKIVPNFLAFKISSRGMSIQKKKMELITENIANTSTTKTKDGTPYKRKFLAVAEKEGFQSLVPANFNTLKLKGGGKFHLEASQPDRLQEKNNLVSKVKQDNSEGELVYMPDHPDANEDGYVQMPNVNVVTEMVDMIAASRSFEANLTAFNASKQIAKSSLEI